MSKHAITRAFLAAILLSLSAVWQVWGSGGLAVQITRMTDTHFPQVEVWVSVVDETGWPVTELTAKNFVVMEDQKTIPTKNLFVENNASQPLSLVLAVDTSIDKPDMGQIQTALTEFVKGLNPDDQVALMTFGDQVALVQNFTADTRALNTAIVNLICEGNYTALNNGFVQAAQQGATATSGRKAVIILTDSVDNAKTLATEEAIQQASATGTPVYLIGYGPKVIASQLSALADSTGAQAFVFNGAGEVGAHLRLLGYALRQGYRLSFTSDLAADKAQHDVSVQVTLDERVGQVAGQFTAVPGLVIITGPGFDTAQPIVGHVYTFAEIQAPAAIKRVEFLWDGTVIGEVTQPPYSFDLDTGTALPGPHTYAIRATDVGGNVGELAWPVMVAVPPPMTLTLLASAKQAAQGDNLTLTAQPVTTGKIQQVEFLLGTELLGTVITAPYAYTFNTGAFEVGEHQILVRAQDNHGQQAEATQTLSITTPLWQTGLRYGLFGIGWLGVGLLAIFGLALFVRLTAAQTAKVQALVQVELHNTGNMRSRYDLHFAPEMPNQLKGQFMVNGEALATVAHNAPAPVNVPVRPAASAPAADAPKASNGWMQTISNLGRPLLELVATVGYMMPGQLGTSMRRMSANANRAETSVDRLQNAGERVAQAGGANRNQPIAVAAAPSGAVETSYPAAVSANTSAAPSGRASINAGSLVAPNARWAETLALEPDDTLIVHLRISPIGGVRAQPYNYRVLSRSADADQATPVVERGTLQLKGLSILQRVGPLMAGLVCVGLAVLSGFLLWQQW